MIDERFVKQAIIYYLVEGYGIDEEEAEKKLDDGDINWYVGSVQDWALEYLEGVYGEPNEHCPYVKFDVDQFIADCEASGEIDCLEWEGKQIVIEGLNNI